MEHEQEAAEIRARRPDRRTYDVLPSPYVGYISLKRRGNGGYVVSAMGYDDQAGQLEDGSLAVELLDPRQVEQTAPDHLARALERAEQALRRLRFEAAPRMMAALARELSDVGEPEALELVRRAFAEERAR